MRSQPDKAATETPPKTRRTSRSKTNDQARAEFLARAQQWLVERNGRQVRQPEDLASIAAAVGVPCERCGALARRRGDSGHDLEWKNRPGEHWAAGITATCTAIVH